MPCFQENPGPPYFPSNSDQAFPTQAECEESCSDVGACCRGEVCTQEKRCECEKTNNGAFQGPGVPCDPSPCPCVIDAIESIEITILAEDKIVERQCPQVFGFWCFGVVRNSIPHQSFFPGQTYSGTYALTQVQGTPNVWQYVFEQQGQVCGGYISATINRGQVLVEVSVRGIAFDVVFLQRRLPDGSVEAVSPEPRPTEELTCETLLLTAPAFDPNNPLPSDVCGSENPVRQYSCEGLVKLSLPCNSNRAVLDGIPVCLQPQNVCGSAFLNPTESDCTVAFSEICIDSISITYAE